MPELIPAEPGTPEWLAARRQGVTATDIVSILGIGYKSAYWLYWNKLGQVPDEPDNDRFRLGRELEPYVLKRWATEQRWSIVMGGGLYRHSDRPWQLATLDQWVRDGRLDDPSDNVSVLELKSWADADRHSWTDGPPAAVRAQVLWQMDVMDVATGYVGVVFLPSGEFRSYEIMHEGMSDPGHDCSAMWDTCRDLALMRERGAEFWARLQGELPPPDIDASAASLAAVKARFGDARKEKVVQVDLDLWLRFSASANKVTEWEDIKRKLENQIREQAGEAGAIEAGGQLVARRLVYDAQVKEHIRHVDSIRRVKQQGDDSE